VKEKKSLDLCFIVQARMGSSRLPNKMILPFFKKLSILEIILKKLKSNFPDIKIILATPISNENDSLVKIAKKSGCAVYRGSEENVLERLIEAATYNNYNNIIRVCADNPFLDIKEMKRLIEFTGENFAYDYISFKVNDQPSIISHFGFWSEYVKLDALKSIASKTSDIIYQEHVTNYIYGNPNNFKIYLLEVNAVVNGINYIRMTLDTLDDFKMLSDIYSKLNSKYGVSFGVDEIIEFMDLDHDYRIAMKKQINLNSK
jgi:spore coat polysaccharide biosynthesis protein SpsF